MNAKSLAAFPFLVLTAASIVAAQAPLPVSIQKVTRQDLTKIVEVPATVRSNETADLYSKVGGYLKAVNVDIGDEVKKGDILAELEIPELKSQLAQKQSRVRQSEAEAIQSKAAIKQAQAQWVGFQASIEEAKTKRSEKQAMVQFEEAEFTRLSQLAGQGAIRRELVDSARYKLQAAQAGLAAAEAHIKTAEANLTGAEANVEKAQADELAAKSKIEVALADLNYVQQLDKYATLRAPFDGQVTQRMFDNGAFIQNADGNSAAKPILQISQMEKIRVTFAISMSDISGLDKGDEVILNRIAALPGKSFKGKISRFSAALDKETRMLRAEVDMDNKNRALSPGYFGYVKITLAEFENAVVIPASALHQNGDEQFVFLADGNRSSRRIVKVSLNDGKQAVIEDGLNGGENLIVSHSGQLKDGQAIEIR